MSANIIPKFSFKHYETCIIAFFSDLERKIHFFNNKCPVLFNSIDESYYLIKKYKKLPQNKVQEIYNVVPRLMLRFTDIAMLSETFTSNYLKQQIKINDKDYEVTFRQGETSINFDLNFVCSNFIMGLRYLELLNTIFCVDNTATYEYDGNNYDLQYSLATNLTVDQKDINYDNESKNAVVTGSILLTCKPSFYNIKNLQNKFYYNNNNEDLVDTDILIDNETGENINLWLEDGEVVNSKLNSVQPYNDLSFTEDDLEDILNNSHTKK